MIAGLDDAAAAALVEWCAAEHKARSARTEPASYTSRFNRAGDGSGGLVDGGEPVGKPTVLAVQAVMALIAYVWEQWFDEWDNLHPNGAALAAHADATRDQREVIAKVWTQAALLSGASASAAVVAAIVGPDWPDTSEGATWVGLLAAAEAAIR